MNLFAFQLNKLQHAGRKWSTILALISAKDTNIWQQHSEPGVRLFSCCWSPSIALWNSRGFSCKQLAGFSIHWTERWQRKQEECGLTYCEISWNMCFLVLYNTVIVIVPANKYSFVKHRREGCINNIAWRDTWCMRLTAAVQPCSFSASLFERKLLWHHV